MKETRKLPLIIGVGNDLRGDDALGIRVVQLLENEHPDLGEYMTIQGDVSRVINYWGDRDILMVDAISSNYYEPGMIHMVCSVDDLIKDKQHQYSTHGLGITEALHMGQLIHSVPSSLLFIGVEGVQWKMGDPLSEKVEHSIPIVKQRVLNYIRFNLDTVSKDLVQ